jgi:hypothetical protein
MPILAYILPIGFEPTTTTSNLTLQTRSNPLLAEGQRSRLGEI